MTIDDLAEDGSHITVNKAVKIVNSKPVIGPPKSTKSERCIPVAPTYRPLVMWLRTNGSRPYLWCNVRRDNCLYTIGTFRQKYYRAIAKLPDVRQLSPHCCRHTYVTLLQSEGVAMETIARLTGHSDIKTTNGYLHMSDDTLASAVQVLDDMC